MYQTQLCNTGQILLPYDFNKTKHFQNISHQNKTGQGKIKHVYFSDCQTMINADQCIWRPVETVTVPN